MVKPYQQMAAAIALTAFLGSFSSYRFTHAGQWLPRMPSQIGAWQGIEKTVPASVLSTLGNPQALSFDYVNMFGEKVEASLVAAGPFENYHDPTVCVSGPTGAFTLTARKVFDLDGPGSGKVRAMVFRHRRVPTVRIIMYYWQQNRDGSTATEARMGNYRDIAARFQTGFGAVVLGHQTVLARIFKWFDEEQDPGGVHTQHSVHEVARAVYRSLREQQ